MVVYINVLNLEIFVGSISHIYGVCFPFLQVKLFPGKDKFETISKPESWPVYNQNFNFEIANISVGKISKPLSEVLRASNFLVFTIYTEDFKKKKKTLGAVTWPLDHTLFTHKANSLDYGSNEEFETPEIWKKTEEISSGIAGVKQKVSQLTKSIIKPVG